MTNNVTPMFGRKKLEEPMHDVPENIRGPIQAITNWAASNGIDIHNDARFHIRLADFMALMQSTAAEKARQAG